MFIPLDTQMYRLGVQIGECVVTNDRERAERIKAQARALVADVHSHAIKRTARLCYVDGIADGKIDARRDQLKRERELATA